MSDLINNKRVPRLRFPSFDENWGITSLEKIGKVIRGASPRPKGDPRFYGGDVPRLMVQDVTRDGKYVTPRIDYLTEAGSKLSRPCKAGTLTIVCSGTVGIVSFLAVDACIHDGFLALIDIDHNTVDDDFLYHQLSTLREKFERSATHGGVFTNLTTTGIKEFIVRVTVLEEQRKIAAALQAVDDKLTALRRKRERLTTYKRGLMQQLFSQELRFTRADGRPFPDWEVRRIGSLIEEFKENSIVQDQHEVFTSARFGLIRQKDYYENARITDRKNIGFNIIPPNYITYRSRSDNRSFYFNENSLGETGIISVYYPVFRFVNGVNKFFTELFAQNRHYIGKFSVGTSQTVLSLNELKKIKFLVPCPEEQQKIADCLTAVDDKINAVAQQIDQIDTCKKGLLQQMFV